MVSYTEVIKFMNELLVIDPKAITALIETRVPCNEDLATHPTVQVASISKLMEGSTPEYSVGLLGILNGLCGARKDGYGFITCEFDDNGNVTGFSVTKNE